MTAPVQALIADVARSRPDAVAVRAGDLRLTYAELDRRGDRLAGRLRDLGVGREDVVGVLAERRPETAVALLGVLKAGAAYLPLDPAVPIRRSLSLLEEVRAELVLTTGDLGDRPAVTDVRWLAVAALERSSAPEPGGPACQPHPEQLAYVIATSGSTGRPKVVMVPHAALASHARAISGRFGLSPDDRVLQFASLTFDVAAEELYATWVAGAEVVLLPQPVVTPSELEALVDAAGVTVLNLPAAYWTTWVWDRDMNPRPFPPSVRLVVIGSESVPAEALRAWQRHGLGRPPLLNGYGVTEATITSTIAELDGESVSIGHPIANTAALVVNDELLPVPPNEAGELLLAGEGVARGYLGRPDLTAERFVPDPSPDRPGGRVYRTGDLVRRGSDGALEFLGRMDDQLKVRGVRIEPAEIVAQLLEHPDVAMACVMARQDRPGPPRLAAYLVPRDLRRIPGAGQLRRFLGERLPTSMVPDAFVVLDAMPLTPGGKVDRRALPAAGPGPAAGAGGTPATGLERTVADIWREVLGLPEVGVDDDLLELGGSSLAAMQIAARVRRATGADLSAEELLDARTVGRLARLLERRDPAGRPTLPDLQPAPRTGSGPLSLQQEQVWFLTRLAPESVAYHAQTTIRLTGRLDAGVLRRSLDELVRRHEILRTTFEERDGRPRQVVHPPSPAHLEIVAFDDMPARERDARVETLVGRELRRPFDLARLPLARWTLIRLGEEEHEIVLVEHHLVHDGWSFALLMAELSAVYGAFARGERPTLPDPPVQYADYARWQRAAMDTAGMRAQLDYWRERLDGAPRSLDLPLDRPRPRQQSFNGGLVRVELPQELRTAVRTFCREHDVTLFMTLLSAFVVLVGRLAGQRDVCVGSAYGNRRQPETAGLLGMLVNTVALRLDLTDDPTVTDLLARARSAVLEAAERQELPFGRVVESLNPERDLAQNPVVQVMFSFDDAPLPELELGDCAGTVFERHNGSSKMDIHVVVEPRSERRVGRVADRLDDRITLLWSYNSDLFDAATAERMVRRYVRLLEAAVAAADARVSSLALLDEDEVRALQGWAAGPPLPPAHRLAHAAFEARAAEAPDAPAVRLGGTTLAYAELDRRANRLAHGLRSLGVGPDAVVALAIPRSIDLVVAILAVLKAGGCYLPADPSEPVPRLRQLLASAGATVMLSLSSSRPDLGTLSGLRHDLCLDALDLTGHPADAPVSRARLDCLAYVICTSGSTGAPKAVAVTHRALVSRLLALQDAHGLTPRDRVLQKTPATFDVSVWEVLWPLSSGALLVLAEPEGHRDPAHLADLIARERITTAHFVPPMLEAFLDQPDLRGCASLTRVASGGQALAGELRDRFLARMGAELHNFYGPTETCIEAVAWRCRAGEPGPVPIGRPIAGTEAYVLGAGLELVPAGVAGELCIGGPGLARGYLSRPDLTAERFVPHPFSSALGARLYRTGDLARWRAEGSLDFLGRADQQVKLRGYRIEPAEVEHALRQHPLVAAAHVAFHQPAPPAEGGLVAYVVPRNLGQPPGGRTLREHLLGRLPVYMVPETYVPLERLPLTVHGKLDRSALPDPAGLATSRTEVPFRPPSTPLQRELADVWQQVLGRQRIGVEDDFFQLGGHSLLAARIVARVRDSLGHDVSIVTLFDHPTIASFATALGEGRAPSRPSGAAPGPP
jgi:amino acid adenylation domain-containing protein